MKLVGIEISNFRSIGKTPVVLDPLRKCNLIVGQNNVGKSNVLTAIQRLVEVSRTNTGSQIDPLDIHRRDTANHFTYKLRFHVTNEDDEIYHLISATSPDFTFKFSWNPAATRPRMEESTLFQLNTSDALLLIRKFITGSSMDVPAAEIGRYLTATGLESIFLNHFAGAIPNFVIIPDFRQITSSESLQVNQGFTVREPFEFAGRNLIPRLARLQHPDLGHEEDRMKFRKMQNLLRQLLRLPDVEFEVLHNNTEIMMNDNDLRLPLSHYGTGVHEVIILTHAFLSLEKSLVCVEEPEIHLHPTLQRALLSFVTTFTDNTYFFTTHSPTLVNAKAKFDQEEKENIQIFFLRRDEHNNTVGKPILEATDSLMALDALGVSASDLLQSNCIVWVEGPSDRIYFNRWLQILRPDLKEGLHYSVMFYGGKLLSHLSVDRGSTSDESLSEELINILGINQRVIVIMDSDRRNSTSQPNETKLRIKSEVEQSGGICWITDGREIENYIPARVVASVVHARTGIAIEYVPTPYSRFETALDLALQKVGLDAWNYARKKPRLAAIFAAECMNDDLTESLRNHLSVIAHQIGRWNNDDAL